MTTEHGEPTKVRMVFSSYDAEEGFDLNIEPEGMSYNFPPEREVVIEFRGGSDAVPDRSCT
ncbi:hypothetical protein [Dactylosporangium sp. CA-139066]|uniref:hypothetical protein n=1 Tax=Dactylosporangium sp. CA-139066 TaxID=3239930 RepID=UPI003D90F79D